jgi:hypothetical protein
MPDGRHVWDPACVAVDQLEPTWATAVICLRCLYVGIVPSIPSRPITWTCSSCRLVIPLTPPGEVLEAIRPAGQPVVAAPRRLWTPS